VSVCECVCVCVCVCRAKAVASGKLGGYRTGDATRRALQHTIHKVLCVRRGALQLHIKKILIDIGF
jgi:hypothetical protein